MKTFICQCCKELTFCYEVYQTATNSLHTSKTIKNYNTIKYKNKHYYFCSNQKCQEEYEIFTKFIKIGCIILKSYYIKRNRRIYELLSEM